MIAMFFTINLLFGGIANPWFLFPSAPVVVTIMLHRRRKAAEARARRRLTSRARAVGRQMNSSLRLQGLNSERPSVATRSSQS
jgi:hypothetical protein